MNAFLRTHRVLAVKKEFVSDGENSFWTFCLEYLESGPASFSAGLPGRPKVDYKEVLKPEEFEVFDRAAPRKCEAVSPSPNPSAGLHASPDPRQRVSPSWTPFSARAGFCAAAPFPTGGKEIERMQFESHFSFI